VSNLPDIVARADGADVKKDHFPTETLNQEIIHSTSTGGVFMAIGDEYVRVSTCVLTAIGDEYVRVCNVCTYLSQSSKRRGVIRKLKIVREG